MDTMEPDGGDGPCAGYQALQAALEHAAAREAELRGALTVAHDNLNLIGRHFDSCPMYPSCTCGLNEAQEIARAALAGEPK